MRGIAFAVLIVIAVIARADVAPRTTRPIGFDHAGHAAKAEVPCAHCHVLERGAIAKPPGHAACFTGCHADQPPKLPVPADNLRFCNVCHGETALVTPIDRKALSVTAAQGGIEHAIQLGHAAHRQIACEKCHDLRAQRRDRPHARCVGCHGERSDKTFAISACENCHPPGNDRPHLLREDGQIVVTSAFSHAKHATRGAAKQCATCHAALSATDTLGLPRPALTTCTIAGCHDGAASFGATTSCTKCHKDVPGGKLEVSRSETRYKHGDHDARTKLPCATCHPLSKTGEVRVANHTPCATTECHAADFTARQPKTCVTCHTGTEPWRPLVADQLPSDVTEFGATLDHGKHAQACATCHSLTTTRTELRPPRGHRACATAGCHAVAAGPAPRLTECESCHQRKLAETRETTRLTASWSVRATFIHARHPASTCTACHRNLSSPTVLSLATPAKATCAVDKCHDGTAAFKVTGTGCTRCHPGVTPR